MSDNETDDHIRARLVLELAEQLGNVSQACLAQGVTRTQYYRWKKRYVPGGTAWPARRPPIANSHPNAVDEQSVDRIRRISLAHPAAGCDRVSQILAAEGTRLSGVTVQKYLDRFGLGTREKRAHALEAMETAGELNLDETQQSFVRGFNPAFGETTLVSSMPGALVLQDTCSLGRVDGIGRLYLHSVIDAYTQQAFALVDRVKSAEAAVTLLHEQVLPFHEDRDAQVDEVATSQSTEFCGELTHPYELFLMLNGISHRCLAARSGQSRRFVMLVRRHFLQRFARAGRECPFSVLTAEFADWLERYNATGSFHVGYPNQGRAPREMWASEAIRATATEGR